MIINHNIPAIQAYNALTATNSALQKSIQRLSTGLRINSAADDAAGLAISEKMRAQIRGLDRAVSNSQDGISMIQTAEGALGETHAILQRMRELSVQAANDTLTQEDRGYIQLEVDQLKEEITRIANTTQFNKKKLLDGSAAVLWSSDNLATKAIVRGGLRQIDQFGQKAAVEGNFKVMINATPGQAEIQKTDIFKIKHKNVIMNLSIDKNNGFQSIEVDNLPAGKYNVYQSRYSSATVAASSVTITTFKMGAVFSNFAGLDSSVNIRLSGIASAAASGMRSVTAHLYIDVNAANGVYCMGTHYTAGSTITVNVILQVNSVGVASGTVVNSATWAGATVSGESAVFMGLVSNFYRAVATNNTYMIGKDSFQFGGFYGLNSSNANMVVTQTSLGNLKNASILLEVLNVNTAIGEVTFRAQVNEIDAQGNLKSYVDDNLIIGLNGVAKGYNKLGFTFIDKSAITITNASNYKVGHKLVLNTMSTEAGAVNDVSVSATINKDWPDSWGNPATKQVGYRMDMNSLVGKDVQFKHFYLNSANGRVYEGNIKITFNDDVKNMSAGATKAQRASFEAAYIGQVAKGDVKLRDLDKFWDANGRFLLEDPKELTIYQGNGKVAKVTLYATDTLEDARKKLNDAIAYQLGQSQYVKTPEVEFVSFVENPIPDNPMSVAGTFVLRSLIPGAAGQLNFSGDEDIIKALSLNVIQEARETSYRVSVADAHNAKNLASNIKITGNVLYGIINPNVDVEFDAMANIEVKWNPITKKFDLAKADGTYETIVHLADNTTVFQIGANEGEDMGINIGDMSAHALGIYNVLVTDRESAARSITLIDNAIGKVSTQRAKLGAYQNRLEHTITNLTTASTNTTAAESRIRDADMAKEMMEFTKLNILSQAGNSMLAQANQLPQNVLSLLR